MRKLFSYLLLAGLAVYVFVYISFSDSTSQIKAEAPAIATKVVAAKNLSKFVKTKALIQQNNDFQADGWKFVKAERPQSLVSSSIEQVHLQLNSMLPNSVEASELYDLAISTSNKKTLFLAIEALGRANRDMAVQQQLINIYRDYRNDDKPSVQEHILSLLKPRNIDDVIAKFIFNEIGSGMPEDLQTQAFVTIAVMGLSQQENQKIYTTILDYIPSAKREQFSAVWKNILYGKWS